MHSEEDHRPAKSSQMSALSPWDGSWCFVSTGRECRLHKSPSRQNCPYASRQQSCKGRHSAQIRTLEIGQAKLKGSLCNVVEAYNAKSCSNPEHKPQKYQSLFAEHTSVLGVLRPKPFRENIPPNACSHPDNGWYHK